jgi:choline kinase
MSDEQLDILAKQRKTLQLQLENSARAQKVADLKFYNRQRLLYPNAEIFYEPTTYSSLIQDEAQSLNTSNDRNKALLEAELYTITTNKNIIRQILTTLTDTEIEALVYFFPDFKNELMRNTNSNAVS